ncbi:hypothetical protein SLEP1_g39564 [Rubroshorea leprosula]|uniref:Uncharacterized protein n=1 Tax=Rubroshorea leprosula TaxID=152421 RepID=A0AAV5L0K6_9ROSI|nr:hypothetical protein SLEP1_g39564 [Rubroshorea leprosula]
MALQERGRLNRAKGPRAAKRGGVRPSQLETYLYTHTTRRPEGQEDATPVWVCPEAEQTYTAAHQKYVEKHGPNKEVWPGWDPEIWKDVVGPPKKGQMRGLSTLQDPAKHGIPWRRYEISEASSSTTRMLTTQVHQLQAELAQVREEMAERVQSETARIQSEVSQRVSKFEVAFDRRFQEHIALLSQQYASIGFPPSQTVAPSRPGGPSQAVGLSEADGPSQATGSKFDHLSPPT